MYVFMVDTGCMMQLEMNLALETVTFLKTVLARQCAIPPDKQVLLISGGESLNGDDPVCKYSTGTDTNPIFLFSMLSIERMEPPEISADFGGSGGGNGSGSGGSGGDSGGSGSDNLKEKVEASLTLKDAQSTVAVRATLAQEYVRCSSEQTRICETLIHDQHLQHQGWLAVVANLEDLATDLRKKSERMESYFNDYLIKRDDYQLVIDTFDDDLAVLHQIPVFPALLKSQSSESMAGSVVPGAPYSEGESVTLLEWISSRGSNQSLEQVADACFRTIQQMDEDLLSELKVKVSDALTGSANAKMKEIRGLGERLSGLEQLHLEAKRLVQEQQDLAAAFVHNQQRASGLRDASILPDLCASHKQQLMVMSKNHERVVSIRDRCAKAKGELSANLHQRMKWVVYIQNQFAEVSSLILMHIEELRRLGRKLEVIEQLHLAPSMFMATVVEVVRRRAFSQHYLEKAATLADTFSNLHEEEIALRMNYQSKLKKHFLSKMFPGMDDLPPAFATSSPKIFDEKLPEITLSDVDNLRRKFPDLAKSLSVPESNALSNLLARSINQKLSKEDGETLNLLQNLPGKIKINSNNDIGSMSVMNRVMAEQTGYRMKNRSGFRRHTDDTDTDSDEAETAGNGKSRSRIRSRQKSRRDAEMTRSLPLEASTMTLTTVKENGNAAAKDLTNAINGVTASNANTCDGGKPTAVRVNGDDAKKDEVSAVAANAANSSGVAYKSSSSADPSSSSGPTTANNSSVAPSSSTDGSVMKSHLNDSSSGEAGTVGANHNNPLIVSLNNKVAQSEARVAKLQSEIKPKLIAMETPIKELKRELAELRLKQVQEGQELKSLVSEFREKLTSELGLFDASKAEREAERLRELEAKLRGESKSQMESMREKLDVEQHKLADCHREIEIYRRQLENATENVDALKAEMSELKDAHAKAMEKQVSKAGSEKESALSNLMLEHEVEMESLKNRLENSERVAKLEAKVKKLQESLDRKDSDVEALRKKARLLEKNQEEKFLAEKDKIVQILEASFVQREKSAVQESEDLLTAKFARERESLERELRGKYKSELDDALIEAKLTTAKQCDELRVQFEREYEELQNRQQEISGAAVEGERAKWHEELKVALQCQEKQLRQKYKFEVDALRARFKMMQTTGALDRSPSTSESELSAESPRQDMVENIRYAVSQEYQNLMRMEKSKFEQRILQMQDDHEQAIAEVKTNHQKAIAEVKAEVKARNNLKGQAEQQVKFGEAMAKAMEKKDAQMKEAIEDKERQMKLVIEEKEEQMKRAIEEKDRQMKEAAEESEKRMKKVIEKSDREKQMKEAMMGDNDEEELKNLTSKNLDLAAEVQRLQEEVREQQLLLQQQQQQPMHGSVMGASVMTVPMETAASSNSCSSSAAVSDSFGSSAAAAAASLTQSMTSAMSKGNVSVTSVDKGQVVMIVWDEEHNSYVVYTEGSGILLHFLHTESIPALGLTSEAPRRRFITGEVVHKELCQAKKAQNRFRVPQGTRFYRVKCKPVRL